MDNAEELKNVLTEYVRCYEIACENSRAAYIKGLAPGARLPKEGVIYGDDEKARFANSCTEYREKMCAFIDDEESKVKSALTAAPSTDAVNACTLLDLRASKDRAEYERLMEKYSNDPQTCDTIQAIAAKNGVHDLPENGSAAKLDALENLRRQIMRSITPKEAEEGKATTGYIALLSAVIDDAIQAEH